MYDLLSVKIKLLALPYGKIKTDINNIQYVPINNVVISGQNIKY